MSQTCQTRKTHQGAVAVLVVVLGDRSSAVTETCAWVYLVARLVYVPAYAFGPPGLRSVFWQGGQIGILVILADAKVDCR